MPCFGNASSVPDLTIKCDCCLCFAAPAPSQRRETGVCAGGSSARLTLPYALRREQKLLIRGAGAQSADALQFVTAGSLCICFIWQTGASSTGREAPQLPSQATGDRGSYRAAGQLLGIAFFLLCPYTTPQQLGFLCAPGSSPTCPFPLGSVTGLSLT